MEHPPTYMNPCDPFSHLHYTPVHLYSIIEIVPFWHLSYTHILVYIGKYCCRKDSPKRDSRLKHTHIVHFDVSACMRAQSLSCVWLFVTPQTWARQASLSMESSRQALWSGLPFPTPGDLSDPAIRPTSPALAGSFFTIVPPVKWKSFSHVWLFATPWTVALQAPLSIELSRQEYWSG